MDGGDSDNGSAQAGIDMSTQASIANKGIQADTDPNMIASSLVGFLGTAAGVPLSGAAGFGTVPRDGYTGSEGTIGPNGGMFNSAGREIDQISGKAYNSYGSGSQFYNGTYMSNIRDQNTIGGTLGAVFSDPDNAFKYDRAADALPLHMQFALEKSPMAQANVTPDEMNPGLTQDQKDMVATKKGFDMGIPAHSMENNSATHDALGGLGYSSTNAAPPGSQYSKSGTFSTSNSDNNNDSNSTSSSNSNNSGSQAGTDGPGSEGNSDTSANGEQGDWNQGGLIPPPNMGRRAQDIPNPMMQDPFGDIFRRT
jgi:hypothetical protein